MLGLGQTSNFSWDKLNLVVFKFMKSSTSGSVKFVWISLDRPSRRIERLKIVSGTNVDLHMRRTKLIYTQIVWWRIFSPARSGENRRFLEFDFQPNGRT